MTTYAVELHNVSKSYAAQRATSLREQLTTRSRPSRQSVLADINLTVTQGEWLAVVGANGSGKSTLLKLIAGLQQPDTGSVITHGRLAASIDLGTGFHPELTAIENVVTNGLLLGLRRSDITRRLSGILEFAGVTASAHKPLKQFSTGMRLRLAFAITRELTADIILLDEVLAVGDHAFRRRCLATLRERHQQGATIISVTHNLRQIPSLASRAAYLKAGQLVSVGDPTTVVAAYQADQQKESIQ